MTKNQLSRDDLAGMPPDEILAAKSEGRLDVLLRGGTPAPPPETEAETVIAGPGSSDAGPRGDRRAGQLSRADLSGMSADAIMRAKSEGRLDRLLGLRW